MGNDQKSTALRKRRQFLKIAKQWVLFGRAEWFQKFKIVKPFEADTYDMWHFFCWPIRTKKKWGCVASTQATSTQHSTSLYWCTALYQWKGQFYAWVNMRNCDMSSKKYHNINHKEAIVYNWQMFFTLRIVFHMSVFFAFSSWQCEHAFNVKGHLHNPPC